MVAVGERRMKIIFQARHGGGMARRGWAWQGKVVRD